MTILKIKLRSANLYLVTCAVASLASLCFASIFSFGLSSTIDQNDSFAYVNHFCDKPDSINSVDKFTGFMHKFKVLLDEQTTTSDVEHQNEEKKINKKCLDAREHLLQLEQIVADRMTDVCHPDYIDRLIEYHGDIPDRKKFIMKKFFKLFVTQVALTCKRNFLERLEIIDKEASIDSSYLMKFLSSEQKINPKCGENCSKSNNQKDDDSDDELDDDDKQQETNYDEEEKDEGNYLIYTQQVSMLMKGFKHIEDFVPIEHNDNAEPLEIMLDNNVVSVIDELRSSCQYLERYYAATILSIARLATIGYQVRLDRVDKNLSKNYTFKRWMVAVQICQPFLRMQSMPSDHNSSKHSQVVILSIDKQSKTTSGDSVVTYGDKFDEFDDDIKSRVVRHQWPKRLLRMLIRKTVKRLASKVDVNVGQNRDNLVGMITAIEEKVEPEDEDQNHVSKLSGSRKFDPKAKESHSYITENTDSFIQYSSFFVSKKLGLVFSLVVAIAVSAVFLTFGLYAFFHWMAHPGSNGGEIDLHLQELRDRRDKKANKIKTSLADRFHLHRSYNLR